MRHEKLSAVRSEMGHGIHRTARSVKGCDISQVTIQYLVQQLCFVLNCEGGPRAEVVSESSMGPMGGSDIIDLDPLRRGVRVDSFVAVCGSKKSNSVLHCDPVNGYSTLTLIILVSVLNPESKTHVSTK